MANVVQDTNLLVVNVGRLTLCQLHNEDSKGPNVHLKVVAFLALNHFWGHPAHSPDLAFAIRVVSGQLSSIPEVCKLNRTLGRDQNIVRLDISV